MEKPYIRQISDQHMRRICRIYAPLRAYFRPVFFGLENIDPRRPTMIVGNHAIYGWEVPIVVTELYRHKKMIVRALGDTLAFSNPFTANMSSLVGIVKGTREVANELMSKGEHVGVAPGGAREANKRKGEKYQLFWKDRAGFIRLAIKYGYTLVPIAGLGPDDVAEILFDGNDFYRTPLGKWVEISGIKKRFLRNGDLSYPLVWGLGPTPLPRPERFYFKVCKPINTYALKGRHKEDEILDSLQEEVRNALLAGLEEMKAYRKTHDPKWKEKNY